MTEEECLAFVDKIVRIKGTMDRDVMPPMFCKSVTDGFANFQHLDGNLRLLSSGFIISTCFIEKFYQYSEWKYIDDKHDLPVTTDLIATLSGKTVLCELIDQPGELEGPYYCGKTEVRYGEMYVKLHPYSGQGKPVGFYAPYPVAAIKKLTMVEEPRQISEKSSSQEPEKHPADAHDRNGGRTIVRKRDQQGEPGCLSKRSMVATSEELPTDRTLEAKGGSRHEGTLEDSYVSSLVGKSVVVRLRDDERERYATCTLFSERTVFLEFTTTDGAPAEKRYYPINDLASLELDPMEEYARSLIGKIVSHKHSSPMKINSVNNLQVNCSWVKEPGETPSGCNLLLSNLHRGDFVIIKES